MCGNLNSGQRHRTYTTYRTYSTYFLTTDYITHHITDKQRSKHTFECLKITLAAKPHN